MKTKFDKLVLIAGACAATLPGTQANAAEGSARLDEVVVTATRNEEMSQDVPISLTALSFTALQDRQISDVLSLSKVTPGMQTKQTFNPMEMTIAIRGVTQLLPFISSDPAIGIYTDGVYNVVNAGSNSGLIDMAQVEILRGPQGTLFGRNTIGGSLNITTAKPTDKFEGYLQGDIGVYGAQKELGVVNVPIIPGKLDTRFVYQHEERDGYGTNFTTGHKTSELGTDYFRGSALFNFNSDWDLWTSISSLNGHGTAAPSKSGYVDPTAGLGLPAPLDIPNNALIPALNGHPGDLLTNYANKGDPQDGYTDIDNTFSIQQVNVRAALTGQLTDDISFKSITGYGKTTTTATQDIDALPYPYLNMESFPILLKQWSQELQLLGDAFDAKLNWITGLYYFHDEGNQISRVHAFGGVRTLFGLPEIYNPVQGSEIDNDSYSTFIQLRYELASDLNITGGVRYVKDYRASTYHDHKEVIADGSFYNAEGNGCALANAPTATDIASCVYKGSADYHYAPWTIGLDYKVAEDILLYTKVSKGYRSGAFTLFGPAATDQNPNLLIGPTEAATANAATMAAFGPVSPEGLLSYEIGTKGDYFDGMLRVNMAAFYSEYNNVQVEEDLPGACPACNPIAKLQNSGRIEIKGAELETTALLGDLTLDIGLGYSEPKYVAGPFNHQPVVNTSTFNGTFNALYPINFSAGRLTLSGNYSYRSTSVLFTPSSNLNGADLESLTQQGYGTVDARVSFDFANAPLTLALYGQNLADETYKVSASAFSFPLSFTDVQYGPPRTFGASLRYQF